jgi:hypothetical protein
MQKRGRPGMTPAAGNDDVEAYAPRVATSFRSTCQTAIKFKRRHCERQRSNPFRHKKKEWITSSLALPCANASRLSQTMTPEQDTRETHLRILAARCARALSGNWIRPSKREGAGNAGCALHPRSRVQNVQKKAHTSIQVQRRQSGIPCAMVLQLIGDRAVLPPSPVKLPSPT